MENNSTLISTNKNSDRIWQGFILVLSNLLMFFPIRFTFRKKMFLESVIFCISAISSIVYHSIISFSIYTLDPVFFSSIKFIDFYIASMTLSIVSIHLINYKKEIYQSIHLFISSVIITFLLSYYGNTDLHTYQLVLIGVSSGSLFLKYIISREMPKWNLKKVLFTLPVTGVAIACFNIPKPYWIFHSLWHVFIMLSIYYALGIPIPFRIIMHRDISLQVMIPSPPKRRFRHSRSFSWPEEKFSSKNFI